MSALTTPRSSVTDDSGEVKSGGDYDTKKSAVHNC
jgi:hypothetical protein